MENWFGFTAGAKFKPTADQCDAFIAQAQDDFEAYTDVAFDETVKKHITVLQWILERKLKVFFKGQEGMAESRSTQGLSVSHGWVPVAHDSILIREMINDIKGAGQRWTHL